ncbi:hypothetical protein CJD35_01880 [Sphingobium xenophagum]|uniref:Uncharacterized protein n=1 Tax=Sphingobium xenophagum TaxID=121428 RepID=A0A249MQB2_SPHXE|nr:hypothetical protein [Sphingobium xenophagum]ASY43339.1 hypothetical protein CJD35_01880 [Sphingobium xenophagum]
MENMMNAKQLERRLSVFGANASALDVVTRKLRESFKVSTAGRGMNAHSLSTDEVAWIIAAYAGSDVAARASETLARLAELIGVGAASAFRHSNDFLATLQVVLGNPDWAWEVWEVRICRNLPIASIHYRNGQIEKFVAPEFVEHGAGYGTSAFRSEGVLSAGFLHQLAIDLTGINDAHE